MICEDKLIGFAGFDVVNSERVWADDTVNLLQIVGTIFANALNRKQADKEVNGENVQKEFQVNAKRQLSP